MDHILNTHFVVLMSHLSFSRNLMWHRSTSSKVEVLSSMPIARGMTSVRAVISDCAEYFRKVVPLFKPRVRS